MMPRRDNPDNTKWMWAESDELGDGIAVDASELLGIRHSTDSAKQAQAMCEAHGLPATIRTCWRDKKFTIVCQVGRFVIDHGSEWVLPIEDLECEWIS